MTTIADSARPLSVTRIDPEDLIYSHDGGHDDRFDVLDIASSDINWRSRCGRYRTGELDRERVGLYQPLRNPDQFGYRKYEFWDRYAFLRFSRRVCARIFTSETPVGLQVIR